MQLTVEGKQMDIGDALRVYVSDNLVPAVEKYFDSAIEASVTFSKAGHQYNSLISVHVGKGILVQGKASENDVHAAFDSAADRIAKQLRRYKRRLKDHHGRKSNGSDMDMASAPARKLVLKEEDEHHEAEPEHLDPIIVAETQTDIDTLSVGEAVMRMNLADLPALMFRNGKHGGLNVVYRRSDGHIGWVDPAES